MKQLLFAIMLTAMSLATASAQLVIAEFGTDTGRFNKANISENNYGWSAGVDQPTSLVTTVSNFAQAVWDLPAPLDLSGVLSETLTLTGDMTTTGGAPAMRIYFYNQTAPLPGASINIAAFQISSDFTGSFDTFTLNDFSLGNSDGLGNTATGSFDWTNVQAIGLRYQNIGDAAIDFTSLTVVPEPTSAALLLGAVSLLTLRSRNRRRA